MTEFYIPRKAILAAAYDWLDTPYQHQASVKGGGCDCLGLIRGVSGAKFMAMNPWKRLPIQLIGLRAWDKKLYCKLLKHACRR